jgi:hypothetical protein
MVSRFNGPVRKHSRCNILLHFTPVKKFDLDSIAARWGIDFHPSRKPTTIMKFTAASEKKTIPYCPRPLEILADEKCAV